MAVKPTCPAYRWGWLQSLPAINTSRVIGATLTSRRDGKKRQERIE